MNILKTMLAFLAVCVLAFAAAAPNLPVTYPLPSEVWILQTIMEMSRNFHMLPLLNGQSLPDQNPLTFMLLSVLPVCDILTSRLVMLLCGVGLSAGVFLFSNALWGRKAGAFAVLFMVSSLAFPQTFGSLNMIAIPHTLTVLAVLLFSRTYIKEGPALGYCGAYLLITCATLLGGLNLAIFFILTAVLLVLFDLAPQRFAGVRAIFALVFFLVSLLIFYGIFRWFGGPATITGSFFPGVAQGFWKGSWAFAVATLPWLPLLVPAWLMTERPAQWEAWRQLLPVKIAFVMALCMIWFSGKTTGVAELLPVPFVAVILGYWAAHGLRIPQRFPGIGAVAKLCFGLFLLILMCAHLTGDLRHGPAFGYLETGIYVGLFVLLIGIIGSVGRRTRLAIYLSVALMLGLGWKQALMQENAPLEQCIAKISAYRPLLVYADDLSMRGFLGYAGKTPLVVQRGFIPLGGGGFLAATTSDTGEMLKELGVTMQAELVSSTPLEKTYALIKVSPRAHLARR